MEHKVRCNNCMQIYVEDELNGIFVEKCDYCNTDEYLMDMED